MEGFLEMPTGARFLSSGLLDLLVSNFAKNFLLPKLLGLRERLHMSKLANRFILAAESTMDQTNRY